MKYLLLFIISVSLTMWACENDNARNKSAQNKTEEEEPVFEEEDLADLYDNATSDRSEDVVTEKEYEERKRRYEEEDELYKEIDREVNTPSENTAEPSVTTNSSSTVLGDYLVVAGSFSQKYNAEDMVRKLEKIGINDARIVYFNAREFHSVGAGYFNDLTAARQRVQMLKNNGIEAYVHARQVSKQG